jgi:hypothetical protein
MVASRSNEGESVEYHKSNVINLKNHPSFNEKWLQGQIAADRSLLGLGDLEVRDIERRQFRAGRLDMLLADPDDTTRYEVEIQLGATDEAHIIRTIEYWDIERSRFPQYDHIAVIVAEDITSRFLNVISLFNRSIPIIAIQMRALEVNGVMTLSSSVVLNLAPLASDSDEPEQTTNREYWVQKSTPETFALTEQLLSCINEVTPGLSLNFVKNYIGLAKNGMSENTVIFRPRKGYVLCNLRIERTPETTAFIDDNGFDAIDYQQRAGRYRLRITESDLATRRAAFVELLRIAFGSDLTE